MLSPFIKSLKYSLERKFAVREMFVLLGACWNQIGLDCRVFCEVRHEDVIVGIEAC